VPAKIHRALRQEVRSGPPMMMNLPDWESANEVLREWQASSRLVEVQAPTGELDEEGKPFGNSLGG